MKPACVLKLVKFCVTCSLVWKGYYETKSSCLDAPFNVIRLRPLAASRHHRWILWATLSKRSMSPPVLLVWGGSCFNRDWVRTEEFMSCHIAHLSFLPVCCSYSLCVFVRHVRQSREEEERKKRIAELQVSWPFHVYRQILIGKMLKHVSAHTGIRTTGALGMPAPDASFLFVVFVIVTTAQYSTIGLSPL